MPSIVNYITGPAREINAQVQAALNGLGGGTVYLNKLGINTVATSILDLLDNQSGVQFSAHLTTNATSSDVQRQYTLRAERVVTGAGTGAGLEYAVFGQVTNAGSSPCSGLTGVRGIVGAVGSGHIQMLTGVGSACFVNSTSATNIDAVNSFGAVGVDVDMLEITGTGTCTVGGIVAGIRLLRPFSTDGLGHISGSTLVGLYIQDMSGAFGTWSAGIFSIYSVGGAWYSGGRIAIGDSAAQNTSYLIDARANSIVADSGNTIIEMVDTTSMASGVGAGIQFGYKYTSGGTVLADGANIKAIKENGTDGNYDTAIVWSNRANGSALAEKLRLTSGGRLGIGTAAPDTLCAINATSGDVTMSWRISDTTKAYAGVAGGASGIVGGSVTGDLCFRSVNLNVLFSIDNGTNADFRITSARSVVVGHAALSTSATDGFLYIPTCAGTPTGVPTSFTGRAPVILDSTNLKLYAYLGAWKQVLLT